MMESISCRPQYWLTSTDAPLCTPKINICTANRGMPKPVLDGALRVSLSYDTAREDVDALIEGHWLTSTDAPLCTPKINICTANRGMLARVTAAMGTSPSIPTIKVSAMPKALVIRFCMTIGRARNATCL